MRVNPKQQKYMNKAISNTIANLPHMKSSCLGCTHSFCCRHQENIDVALGEFELLKSYMDEGVISRAKEAVAGYRLTGRFTCPFLGEDGRCVAYEVRPLACSLHHTISDPSVCDVSGGVKDVAYINKVETLMAVSSKEKKFRKYVRDYATHGFDNMIEHFAKMLEKS